MTKPLIPKASRPARTNRGRDTAPAERRSELIGLLPKRQRLVCNPLTSAQVIPIGGAFGLYCGDEGYFVVQPNPASGFVSVPMETDDARQWAVVHGCEAQFDEYHANLAAILRVHGVLL
jgi:hypothetical protein